MAEDPVGSIADLYKRGNECFVSEDYDRAIELYTAALEQDKLFAECYAAKAQAYIKTERFELAKKEANRGIDMLFGRESENERIKTELKKCIQRSGVASFHLGKYREAKNTFAGAIKLDQQDKGLKQWFAWCEEKMAKFGDDASKKQIKLSDSEEAGPPPKSADSSDDPLAKSADSPAKSADPPAKSADSPAKSEDPMSKPAEQPASQNPNAESRIEKSEQAEMNQQMPAPTIKHDWYQTETHVIIEVRIKKLAQDDVSIDFHEASLSVTAKLASGSEYSLELDLAHPVVPNQSTYKVLSTKLEIKLRKGEGVRWSALEGEGVAPVPGAAPAVAVAGAVKPPYASGRDWSRVEKELEKELDDKKEGEQALNEMFQKIYGDANDDVRKAMNKSFSESGGTVLSTNWAEIGKEKVTVKPPDGMEFKKY